MTERAAHDVLGERSSHLIESVDCSMKRRLLACDRFSIRELRALNLR